MSMVRLLRAGAGGRAVRPRCFLVLAVVVALLGSGCGSSSQLSNAWRDPGYSGGPPRSALVLAMKKDQVTRRLWEDAFAAELAKHGVEGTPSYQYFPDAVPDTTAISAAMADPSSPEAVKKEVVEMVIPELVKQKLIPPAVQ